MKRIDSVKSGFKDREDKNWADGVHIRQERSGITMYAVFDDIEQVSDEVGPLGEDYIINFAEGYSEAKKRYA